MRVTVLGTSNPFPQLERAGTGIALSLGDDTVLVDCGPMTVYRLVEHEIDMTRIEDLFFTHHHMDHNAAFFQFAIYSWRRGRRSLTVYGPDGTRDLLDALDLGFRRHIESWKKGLAGDDSHVGIDDIEYRRTTEDLDVAGDGWRASAFGVDHSVPAFGYRFDEPATGRSFVFSGDTRPVSGFAEFAAGADVLVHEANDREPSEGLLDESAVPGRYLTPPFDEYYRSRSDRGQRDYLGGIHSTPVEAAEVAAKADVDTLVLTHFNPYRDPGAVRESAETVFDGTVLVGEDGLTLSRP